MNSCFYELCAANFPQLSSYQKLNINFRNKSLQMKSSVTCARRMIPISSAPLLQAGSSQLWQVTLYIKYSKMDLLHGLLSQYLPLLRESKHENVTFSLPFVVRERHQTQRVAHRLTCEHINKQLLLAWARTCHICIARATRLPTAPLWLLPVQQ